MTRFGYTLMTEQSGPQALVGYAAAAEQAGFDFLVSSDHYFPWLDSMGHAPYAWSILGAATQVTERVELLTYVTCPTMRYHPAVVAQKAATLGLLSNGRFTLGLGSGENLTSTSSGRAGRRSRYARRCSKRRSRSSAGCSAAINSPLKGTTSGSTRPGSGIVRSSRCRSASRSAVRRQYADSPRWATTSLPQSRPRTWSPVGMTRETATGCPPRGRSARFRSAGVRTRTPR